MRHGSSRFNRPISRLIIAIAVIAPLCGPAKSHAATPAALRATPATKPVPAGKTVAKKGARPDTAKKTSERLPARTASATRRNSDASGSADTAGAVWPQQLPNWIYYVKTASSATAPQSSDTTALALDSKHLVAPLDFVLSSWLVRDDARFFINDAIEAQVEDMDLAGQIVLLRASRDLPSWLPSGRIRTTVPQTSETFFSVEGRGVLHTGVRFKNFIRSGETIRYQLEGATAQALNGQFIFDRFGSLVSVLPKTQISLNSSDLVWGSSTQAIFELARKQNTPKPASEAGDGSQDEKRRQLWTWQTRWTQETAPSRAAITTENLDCKFESSQVSNSGLASKIKRMNTRRCVSRISIPLGDRYQAGLELLSSVIMTRTPIDQETERVQLTDSFAKTFFDDLQARSMQVNLMTPSDCQDSVSTNRRGQSVNVRFCTSALKNEQGLSDTVISVVSPSSGGTLVANAVHLKGFDQANTKVILETLIESGEVAK